VTHRASVRFWDAYNQLSLDLQAQADKQFELLKQNPGHPSLQFKKVGRIWSARVNLAVRALAVEDGADFVWFWIGDHREYERLIRAIKKG
jgi:hypothetical protein